MSSFSLSLKEQTNNYTNKPTKKLTSFFMQSPMIILAKSQENFERLALTITAVTF